MKFKIFIILISISFAVMGCSSDPYKKYENNDLHLKVGDKEFFWFSGIHSNDSNHRMFKDIKEKFYSFNPQLVLVEGYCDTSNYKDEKEAISQGGESGYVSYLAKTENIEVETVEPSFEQQFRYLLPKYKNEDILAMYVLRQVIQYQRESENRNVDFFRECINLINNMISKGFPIDIPNVNSSYVKDIISQYTNFSVDESNWEHINAKELIYSSGCVLNEIWNDTIAFRDEYCVNFIEENYRKYNRIFMIMGADHINNQKHKLEKIYNKQDE